MMGKEGEVKGDRITKAQWGLQQRGPQNEALTVCADTGEDSLLP